jgi:hypothetical protein
MYKGVSVSIEYIIFIMNHMSGLGIDPGGVYSTAGFNSSILKTPGARVPFDQFNTLWNALEDKSIDENLGFASWGKSNQFPKSYFVSIDVEFSHN